MANASEPRHWLGFDLGGTKMLATVFDQDFKPLGRDRKKTKGREGAAAGLERMKAVIRKALDDAKMKKGRLAGIGIGCPGPLDLDAGVLVSAPNLGWENVPLKELLEKEFDCPVHICNDVDAGIYGEYRFGAAQGAHCAIGIFPGTGVGGGCVYEDKILRGRKSSCMEIGHIRLSADGPRSGAGLIGTLEGGASRLTIASQAAAAAFRGQAPYLLENFGTDLTNIRSGALAASIAHGDKAVEEIVRDAARLIGVATATMVCIFTPDVVVLGGGLVEAMPELFVSEVKKSARHTVLPSLAGTFEVAVAKLGDDAASMGAAAWAENRVNA